MAFAKGNQLWVKGVEAKEEKKEKIDALMGMIVGGGMDRYAEIMDKLSDGCELEKCEEQFLDRMDGWREWVRPKLSRAEVNSKIDVKIEKIEQLESTIRVIAGVEDKGVRGDTNERARKKLIQG